MPRASSSRARRMSIKPSHGAIIGGLSADHVYHRDRVTTNPIPRLADTARATPTAPRRPHPIHGDARLQGRAARRRLRPGSGLLLVPGRAAGAAAHPHADQRLAVGAVVGERRAADHRARAAVLRRADDGLPAPTRRRRPPNPPPAVVQLGAREPSASSRTIRPQQPLPRRHEDDATPDEPLT